MKQIAVIILLMVLFAINPRRSYAQSIADDLEELALDYQKLASLKNILKQMEQGYQIVSTGYKSVKNVAQGNFSLHEAFLDGLMVVSPTVRKYPHVADIINEQGEMVREYKEAYSAFKHDKHFTVSEMGYMVDVYNNIISGSIRNLDELAIVMSDNKLRMSDNERLQAIDRVYTAGHDQLVFLRQFNGTLQAEGIRRASQANDLNTLQKIYGIR